jgi:8-oxo-dGTP diphosphatase
MEDPAAEFATPRLASGALFSDHDKIFLVRKTYGNHWDIPGGYVDRGESPASACEREIREELGLTRTARRLLVHDWAPSDAEGDKILYLFDCGELGEDEKRIRFDGVEIDYAEWVAVGDLNRYVIPRLVHRLTAAYQAYKSDVTIYLEYGQPRVLKPGLTDSLRTFPSG